MTSCVAKDELGTGVTTCVGLGAALGMGLVIGVMTSCVANDGAGADVKPREELCVTGVLIDTESAIVNVCRSDSKTSEDADSVPPELPTTVAVPICVNTAVVPPTAAAVIASAAVGRTDADTTAVAPPPPSTMGTVITAATPPHTTATPPTTATPQTAFFLGLASCHQSLNLPHARLT